MNFEQLEAIQAIVEKGSFRAAAEHLHRSQPAVSAAIKNLEEEFNLEIFDRSQYRPRLTEAGRALFEASKKVLEATRYFARVGRELGDSKIETKLRVSIDPLTPMNAIALIAQECARPAFPVTLVLAKSILRGSVDALLSDAADLAIGQFTGEADEVEQIKVIDMHLIAVASRALLGHLKEPTEEFLAKTPQILVYEKEIDEPPVELKGRVERGQRIFAPDHFTKLRMIESSLGWGRISEEELQPRPSLVRVHPRFNSPIHLDLRLMRAKNRALGPIARKIWEVFSKQS